MPTGGVKTPTSRTPKPRRHPGPGARARHSWVPGVDGGRIVNGKAPAAEAVGAEQFERAGGNARRDPMGSLGRAPAASLIAVMREIRLSESEKEKIESIRHDVAIVVFEVGNMRAETRDRERGNIGRHENVVFSFNGDFRLEPGKDFPFGTVGRRQGHDDATCKITQNVGLNVDHQWRSTRLEPIDIKARH